MSVATRGITRREAPGYRYAHPGYACCRRNAPWVLDGCASHKRLVGSGAINCDPHSTALQSQRADNCEGHVNGNLGKAPEDWRNHSTKHPIAASRLKRDDLKRLYKIINDKQIEYRDRFMPILQRQPNEFLEVFEARKKRVFDLFVTSMTIHTSNDAVLHGNNETFLEETNFPDEIWSIFFSTSWYPMQFWELRLLVEL